MKVIKYAVFYFRFLSCAVFCFSLLGYKQWLIVFYGILNFLQGMLYLY